MKRVATLSLLLSLAIVSMGIDADVAFAGNESDATDLIAALGHGSSVGQTAVPDSASTALEPQALGTATDTVGDATWNRGDLIFGGVGLDASAVFVGASTSLFSTPGSTPWVTGTTGIVWDLDVQGDRIADYEVFYIAPTGSPELQITRANSSIPICSGVARYDSANSTYYGTFAPSCIGSPSRLYWSLYMAFTDVGVTSQDRLPNAGMLGPVTADATLPLPAGAPLGRLDSISAGPATIRATGWALDPETAQPIDVHIYVDGSPSAVTLANKSRGDIAALYPAYGSSHGFDASMPASGGPHQVCAYAINVGQGGNALLGCQDTAVPTGSPIGSMDSAAASPGLIQVKGWAIDPDTTSSIDVHVYVDAVATVTKADKPRADIGNAYPAYGPNHGFDVTVAAGTGDHNLCVYGINVGGGDTATLRCSIVTVPPGPPSPVPTSCATANRSAPPPGTAPTLSSSRYVALGSPVRLFDTRSDGSAGYVCPGQTITKLVAGRGGVPSDAIAVALNLTAVVAGGEGFVTVYPTGTTRPSASNLNLTAASQQRPNLVIVPLGVNGDISFYTQSGAHLIADIAGYFQPSATSTSGRLITIAPTRILDTRSALGSVAGRVPAKQSIDLQVAGRGVPADAAAVVLNVTATDAQAAGFVTVWPKGQAMPNASNLNLNGAGDTAANLVIAPLGASGQVSLYTEGGAHLLADVFGYFTSSTAASSSAGMFVPVVPQRVFDTRVGPIVAAKTSINRGHLGVAGVPTSGVSAVVLNITGTQPVAPGFVTAWPASLTRPSVSSLNLTSVGDTRANAAVMPITASGLVSYYAESGAHLVVDTFGYFTG